MKNALAHIGVYVSNLKESQGFYGKIRMLPLKEM